MDMVAAARPVGSSAWRYPCDGDEVCCSLSAVGTGEVLEQTEVDYRLGSGSFGPISKVLDEALKMMKRGEEANIRCSPDCFLSNGGDGGCMKILLHEIHEVRDISPCIDGSMMKKQLKEGEGETPREGCLVKLRVEMAWAEQNKVPDFRQVDLNFRAGNGDMCDCLECAALALRHHELATVACSRPSACREPQLGLDTLEAEHVFFKVELLDFEKLPDPFSLLDEEKLDFCNARKEVGSALFRQGRVELALQRYSKALDLLGVDKNLLSNTRPKPRSCGGFAS